MTSIPKNTLYPLPGALHVRINHYDRDRCNLLINQVRERTGDHELKLDLLGSKWKVSQEVSSLEGEIPGFAVEVSFECLSGSLSSASVSVDLDFTDWSADNYVLFPSAAYNGNRFPSRRIPYSPKLHFATDIGPDKPIIVTDIPKLNDGEGPSRIQERSASMASPTFGFQSKHTKQGVLVQTTQGNSLGDYGIDIDENRDRSKAVISITAPVVRELYNYRNCDMRAPSIDEPKDFSAGDKVSIRFRVYGFDAPEIQSLFDAFAILRKPKATELPNTLPFSACFDLEEEKFNRDNFVPEHGYYSVGPRQNFLQDWQIGWTGGMISTYPLLFAGSEQTRENVIRNFDWLFPNGISPSGFFWDCGRNGTEWLGGDIRKPHCANWHLIRKSADAVFYIIKQLHLMEKLGIEVKPAWRNGTRGVCDCFVKLWNENQQFGQFVDSLSGEIQVGGSTSAAIAPAALALAADYFDEPAYREVAEQSAEYFYNTYTRAGISCGGPGDALQNPDSESWCALIESYVAIHEATGDPKWLERAGETARQFSSWVVSYDYDFPAESTFAKFGIRTTGSVYANTQNKHSAPAVCTLSGLGLFKLFRASGDTFPLELLKDIAHGLPQYLPHPLRPLGDAIFGHMCERVNMTDWEGPDRVGETLHMMTWAETSLMLTTIEIPGLYVQIDQSLVVAFDHVETEIVSEDNDSLTLKITNPTPATARVRILSETKAEAATPLAENQLLHTPIQVIEPGESVELVLSKSPASN